MARFYADENFPTPAVRELRLLGHDVLTMAEDGRASRSVPDADVLRIATAHGRAVLTHNRRDFVRLHREGRARAGIVVYSVNPDFAEMARRIHEFSGALPDLQGRLVRIRRPGRRAEP
ncbi:MAG: DUF5615 family PIN-like protein [Planctomycetales bacterium]|nr:DUF5615 family PIN-like protein [Planctomycetales bacterium]